MLGGGRPPRTGSRRRHASAIVRILLAWRHRTAVHVVCAGAEGRAETERTTGQDTWPRGRVPEPTERAADDNVCRTREIVTLLLGSRRPRRRRRWSERRGGGRRR